MKKFDTVEEQKAFKLGAKYIKGYIAYCLENYTKVFNLAGAVNFLKDLSTFLKGANYIPNIYNMTFEEYCEQY